MADRTSKQQAMAAEEAVASPVLLSGGNPQILKGDGDALGAGVHRGHAGVEERCRAQARRAHRAHGARRAEGGAVELAVVGRRGTGLVRELPTSSPATSR